MLASARGSFLASVLLAACGARGPTLPANVGANHETSGRDEQPSQAPAEPLPAGSMVWADYHGTGFYFHGVVADRRGDMHLVVYTDGAHEWLPAAALAPDALAEEARVHVRPSYGADFREATVARRVGYAVYLRLANGDERWSSLPHLRFARGDAPARGTAPHDAPPPAPGEVGSDVWVDYRGQGLRFAGTVTARDEGGRAHVVYLDGETDWAAPETIASNDVGPGTVVHVRRSYDPPVWVRGRVQQRVAHALRVQFDDGGEAWTALVRVRLPVETMGATAVEPTRIEPQAEPEPAAPPRRRRRPAR